MQDIRVDDSFFGHPKTVRFIRRTGDHGITCLFRLWCYTSRYFPKGILTALNAVEIADAAGWKGDPEEFVSALLDAGGPGRAGFLDKCGSHYGLHNWRKRNPFAYFREERSEVSRKAAETRWDKKKKGKQKQEEDTKGKAERIADSNAERNAPSPAPSPIPFPEIQDLKTGAPPLGVLEAPPPERQEADPKGPKCSTPGCEGVGTIREGNSRETLCRKCHGRQQLVEIPGMEKIGAVN